MARRGLFDEADTDPLDAVDDLIEGDSENHRQREQAATEVACEALATQATTRRMARSRSVRRSTAGLRLTGRRRARHGQSPLGLVVGLVVVALALGLVVALL